MPFLFAALLTLALALPALANDTKPATPGGPCPTADLPEGGVWSDAERQLWPRLCKGEWVKFDKDDGLPCKPWKIEGEVPDARKISPKFLRLILTHPDYASALARPQLRLSCAEVTGTLDLQNDEIRPEFGLFRSRISGDVVLRTTRFHRSVYFQGVTVQGALKADGLKTGGGLFLRGGATFAKDVRLLGAEIGGDVDAIGSTFEGAFRADRLKTGGGLFLRGGATFAKDVRLLGAEIGGNVEAIGSTFKGAFRADGLKTGGDLVLHDGATFAKDVRLLGAEIGGVVSAIGSTFEGVFNANRLKTGGSLFLRGGATFAKDVRLLGAEIGGVASAIGSTFEGAFRADGLKTGGGLYLRGGATFAAIDLLSAQIGGNLQFGKSAFNGHVNLTNARIAGEVLVSSSRNGRPDWGPEARVTFRNVAASALQSEMAAWRRDDESWVDVDLTGFAYGRFGGLNAEEETASPNMADAAPGDLIKWIEKGQPDHDARYDPQPYTELAAALTRAGADRAADEVLYARYEHKRRAATTPGWERDILFVRKIFIGHGVYTFRPLWWFAGLVLIGVIAARWSRDETLSGLWPKIWYSLENALPLVDLKEDHKHVDHERAWVENVFQAQKVLGFVIATVLVGALTLLGG